MEELDKLLVGDLEPVIADLPTVPKDDIKDKIQQYEEFLNETLRTDLKKLLEDRDKIYEEQAEFLSLRNSIKAGCIILYILYIPSTVCMEQ